MNRATRRKVVAVCLAVTLTLGGLLAWGTYYIPRRLIRSVLGSQTEFGPISTNLFSFAEIKDIQSEEQKCDLLRLRYSLWGGLIGQFVIHEIHMEGAEFFVRKSAEKWFIPGVRGGKKGNGSTPPAIRRVTIENSSFHLDTFAVFNAVQASWLDTIPDQYAMGLRSRVRWQGIEGDLELAGELSITRDFQTWVVDSLLVEGRNHRAVGRARIGPDESENYILAEGRVTLPQFFNFLKPAVSVDLPVQALAEATFRMDGVLQRDRILQFTGASAQARWRDNVPFGFSGGARIVAGELRIDSLEVKHKQGNLNAKGSLIPGEDRIRLSGTVHTRPLLETRSNRTPLSLAGRFAYSGALSKTIHEGDLQVDGNVRLGKGRRTRRIGNIAVSYQKGKLRVGAKGFDARLDATGKGGEAFSLSGNGDIADVRDLLQLAGVTATGPGEVTMTYSRDRSGERFSGSVRTKQIQSYGLVFDSVYAHTTNSAKGWELDTFCAYRKPFRLGASGRFGAGALKIDWVLNTESGKQMGRGSLQRGSPLTLKASVDSLDLEMLDQVVLYPPEAKGEVCLNGELVFGQDGLRWDGRCEWYSPQYRDFRASFIGGKGRRKPGIVEIDSLVLVNLDGKRSGFSGSVPVPWEADARLDARIDAKAIPLSLARLFGAGGESLEGRINGRIQVRGVSGIPQWEGRLRADSIWIRLTETAPALALHELVLDGSGLKLDATGIGKLDTLPISISCNGRGLKNHGYEGNGRVSIGPAGELVLGFRKPVRDPMQLTVAVKELPASVVHTFVPGLRNLDGTFHAGIRAGWGGMKGEVTLLDCSYPPFRADSAVADFDYAGQMIAINKLSFHNRLGLGVWSGNLDLESAPAFSGRGQFREFPVDLGYVEGKLQGDVVLKGSAESLDLRAENLEIRNVVYPVPECDQILRMDAARTSLEGHTWKMDRTRARLDSATTWVSGEGRFWPAAQWQVRFRGEGDSVRMSKMGRYEFLAHPAKFDVALSPSGTDLGFDFNLLQGRYFQEIQRGELLQPGRGVFHPDRFTKSQQTRVKIHVSTAESLWVENDLARLRFGGDVSISGNLAMPLWQGRIESYEGEIYYFANLRQPFDLQQGVISFDNLRPGFNPTVDIEAVQKTEFYPSPQSIATEPVQIRLSMHGPLKEIQSVQLESDPGLGGRNFAERKANIIAVMATGRPLQPFLEGEFVSMESLQHQARSMFQYYLQSQTQTLADRLHLDRVEIRGDVLGGEPAEIGIVKSVGKLSVEYSNNLDEVLKSQEVKLQYRLFERSWENLVVESAAQRAASNYSMDVKYVVRF